LLCPARRCPLSLQAAGAVFERFWKLDAAGGQLTAAGWKQIAELFVNPGTPRRDRIIVSDGGGPLGPALEAGKVGVGREYIMYGQIDLPQLRFRLGDSLPGGVKLREMSIDMVKVSGSDGVDHWRIEGPVPGPVVSVDAAIQYVTAALASTKDPTIKRNAERTLASLKRFR
jgi:hypothetical protein